MVYGCGTVMRGSRTALVRERTAQRPANAHLRVTGQVPGRRLEMRTTNVIPFAPALERQRRVMAGISLASWHNHFPDGIEDLWDGPFVRATEAVIIPLRAA